MSEQENPSKVDRLIHIAVVVFVVTCLSLPFLLKAASNYLGWQPPPGIQKILDWLPLGVL